MKKLSVCRICGSYDINPHSHDRKISIDLDLCDVCYWHKRADLEWHKEQKNKKRPVVKYTIRKCREKYSQINDGKFKITIQRYGYFHGSSNDRITFCGKEIDQSWYIETNNYNGNVTCPKCLSLLKDVK